jgi:hypothetical protein
VRSPVLMSHNVKDQQKVGYSGALLLARTRLAASRSMHCDGLYLNRLQSAENVNPWDSGKFLEFCHVLHANRHLLHLHYSVMKLFLPITESKSHIIRIDGLLIVHTELQEQLSTSFLYRCFVRYNR